MIIYESLHTSKLAAAIVDVKFTKALLRLLVALKILVCFNESVKIRCSVIYVVCNTPILRPDKTSISCFKFMVMLK